MTPDEIRAVLDAHEKWLRDEAGGKRANLTGADLRDADLTDANLYGANLNGAYLTNANLTGADLRDADLTDANLYGADLSGAHLYRANLRGADLTGADLTDADLSNANLIGADLTDANLNGAYLNGAYLYRANLTDVILPSGITLDEYVVKQLPWLLSAEGRGDHRDALAAWNCHNWDNCPMAVALGIHKLEEAPVHLRSQVAEFLALFDGRHLEDAPARLTDERTNR